MFCQKSLKLFHECLRVFIADGASLTELIVRHPPEPTTTVSRNMEDEQGVDATLAFNVGRTEIEFRRDTGIYSSEELCTPADFQRTCQYRSLYFDDAVVSRLSAVAFGLSGPNGRPSPARHGALPERPGSHDADRSASERPSYVTGTKGGGRRQADRPSESRADDLEREVAEVRRQLAEMRAESTPGVAQGLTRVDRTRPDRTGSGRDESGQAGADRDDT